MINGPNITIYDNIYLKDVEKEDRCIYLLYINLKDNTVTQDIIYNIMNYKDIYENILNTYRDDLYSRLWKKYKNENVIVYIVKEVVTRESRVITEEIINMFTDIIVESENNNIKTLYTYYNFDTYLNKSLFELYLEKLSLENIKLHVCKNKQ